MKALARLAWVLGCFTLGWGQTTSTEILGTVTDPSGASVPGAKVTLERLATGQTRQTITSTDGNYSFPLIEVGEYHVTVEAAGFAPQEKTGITVQLQQKARLDFQLSVGTTIETVDVTASAISLKT